MKKAWNYLLAEPFTWILYAFFQPDRLERELGAERIGQRIPLMLRLIVPMVLFAYPIGVAGRTILITFHLLPGKGLASILWIAGIGIGIGIGVGIVVGIRIGIVVGIGGGIGIAIGGGIGIGIVVGIVGGIGGGIGVGIVVGIGIGIVVGIGGGIVGGIAGGITFGIAVGIGEGDIGVGIASSLSFVPCYFIWFYRLPFYLVSGPSAFRAYRASRMNPSGVFEYLQHSSLRWDEIVYLPLPYLKQTLLIAYDQDAEKALDEITFIAAERPQQLRAARAALLEIAVRGLEQRKTMSAIAAATQFLDELFPQETKLLAPRWSILITRLREASQDAARFCSPVGRSARLEALQDMLKHMKDARLTIPSGNRRLSDRLVQVINVWQVEAQQARERLE